MEKIFDTFLNIKGEKGNSLFYEPLFKDSLQPEDLKRAMELVDRIGGYMDRYIKSSDDRAIAIVCPLIIESEIDYSLSIWLKGYNTFSDRDLAFYLKVKLMKSLKLIPNKILVAIDPIRKIRNKFVHNLNFGSFDEVKAEDSGLFDVLTDQLESVFGIKLNNESEREKFYKLTIGIVLALSVYVRSLKKVQDYLWNEEKLNNILKD